MMSPLSTLSSCSNVSVCSEPKSGEREGHTVLPPSFPPHGLPRPRGADFAPRFGHLRLSWASSIPEQNVFSAFPRVEARTSLVFSLPCT